MTRTTQHRRPQLVAVLVSFVVVALGLLGVSAAGFSGTTSTPSNAWSSGTVALTDTDSGNALFVAANDGLLAAGQTVTRCINVTYSGTLTNNLAVRLSATASGALAPYLNLTVTEGTGANGTSGSCTGFTTTSTLYVGTVDDFATTHDTFAHGVSAWAISGTPQTRSYRFTITVQDVNASQAKTGSANFRWTAATPPAAAPTGGTYADAITINLGGVGSFNTSIVDLTNAPPFTQPEKDAGFQWTYQDARVWYRVITGVTGMVEINTFPGQYMPEAACGTVVSVATGTPPNLTWGNWGGQDSNAWQTLDPDQTCNNQSRIVFNATAGTPVYIFVQPNAASDRVPALLRARVIAPDTNDNIANAIDIPAVGAGETRTIKYNSYAATREAGEPDPTNDGNPANTLWYRYTAVRNQTLTVDASQWHNGYSPVRMFTGGPAFNTLTQIQQFSQYTPGTVALTAGQTYYLQTLSTDWQGWDYFKITSN